MKTLKQVIENGPNRLARVLGQGTMYGQKVNIRVAVYGFYHARIEFREAIEHPGSWMALGGNYSLAMPFDCFLRAIPAVANLSLMSDLAEVA